MSPQSSPSSFRNPQAAGVYHCAASHMRRVIRLATEQNVTCWHVELHERAAGVSIPRHLGQAMQFPEWYGANLDALADCLCDLSWQAASDAYLLCIQGLGSERTQRDMLIDLLRNVSDAWRAQGVSFWVLLDTPDGALPEFNG